WPVSKQTVLFRDALVREISGPGTGPGPSTHAVRVGRRLAGPAANDEGVLREVRTRGPLDRSVVRIDGGRPPRASRLLVGRGVRRASPLLRALRRLSPDDLSARRQAAHRRATRPLGDLAPAKRG